MINVNNIKTDPRNGFIPVINIWCAQTTNERTAMQTSGVYACVRILAETIASLPLNTYKHTDRGKEKARDHNLYHLLHNEPNPEMTSFVFRETLMSHLCATCSLTNTIL